MTNLESTDSYQKLIQEFQEKISSMPFLRWLGINVRGFRTGYVRIEMPVRQEMLQVAGLLHGGVIASLVDVAGAMAVMSRLPKDTEIRTVEMKINYFRPVHGGTVSIHARCIHLGRSTAVTESIVRDKKMKHRAALGIATFAILTKG